MRQEKHELKDLKKKTQMENHLVKDLASLDITLVCHAKCGAWFTRKNRCTSSLKNFAE